MQSTKRQAVIDELESLSYEDKLYVYSRVFTTGNLDTKNLDDKLVLISLLSLTYKKMKEKDSTITPLKILLSITKTTNDGTHYYQFLESLSIIVEDFSYDCSQISPCGLTSSAEIINKIKTLLDRWLPF
jgi:hypothetical protein